MYLESLRFALGCVMIGDYGIAIGVFCIMRGDLCITSAVLINLNVFHLTRSRPFGTHHDFVALHEGQDGL